jgi:membrane-bound ClpP family serine protease
MSAFLAALSPDAALLILTLGLALIALELNRPGSILPGAVGLLLTLLSVACLLRIHPHPEAVAASIVSMAVLLLQLRRRVPLAVAGIATLALILAFLRWTGPTAPARIGSLTAIACGLFLGIGTTVLTRLARLARQNKGLD